MFSNGKVIFENCIVFGHEYTFWSCFWIFVSNMEIAVSWICFLSIILDNRYFEIYLNHQENKAISFKCNLCSLLLISVGIIVTKRNNQINHANYLSTPWERFSIFFLCIMINKERADLHNELVFQNKSWVSGVSGLARLLKPFILVIKKKKIVVVSELLQFDQ